MFPPTKTESTAVSPSDAKHPNATKPQREGNPPAVQGEFADDLPHNSVPPPSLDQRGRLGGGLAAIAADEETRQLRDAA